MSKIKFKFFALNGGVKEIENTNYLGKTVDVLVKGVLEENKIPTDENTLGIIGVIVNGHQVDKDFWSAVEVRESDDILIHPLLKGTGGGRGTFNFVVALAAAVAVSFIPGVGLPAAALVFTAVYTTLSLVNKPDFGQADLGSGNDSNGYARSQMFTLESQNNSVNKYGFVPKVYGNFKMFPNVAAAPYTDIETNPVDGKLIQYFTAIYDFGFGPASVASLKIGETPITEYQDVTYRLVDLNKPLVSEGVWDDVTHNSFTLYKGEVEQEVFNGVINKNRNDGALEAEYQIIRNASPLVNGSKQEIVLDFVCPEGLVRYSPDAGQQGRYIDLEIYFSKASENVWRSWSDSNYVDTSRAIGGSELYDFVWGTVVGISGSNYALSDPSIVTQINRRIHGQTGVKSVTTTGNIYMPAGRTYLDALDGWANVSETIYYSNGTRLANVVSVASIGGGYSRYNLDAGLPYLELLNYTKDEFWYEGILTLTQYSQSASNPSTYFYVSRTSPGRARIYRNDTSAVYSTFRFTPTEIAEYKVRVTRVLAASDHPFSVGDKDALTFISISSRFDRLPILTKKRHLFIELRIRATNQLNGSLDSLSGVVTSVLDVYDDTTQTWSKQFSSNPAWVFCDLMTNEVNKRAIDKSRLHMPTLVEWAEFCDEVPTAPGVNSINLFPRFSCNFILDFNATLHSALQAVSSASQANLNVVDGLYGVLIDKLKTVPVQIFTPRNSWGFGSARVYMEPIHALRAKYSDPASSWQLKEVVVYQNGRDYNNSDKIEDINCFATTNVEQAWRHGRYWIAQSILRLEQIQIKVDFEHLVCTRGDYVKITQDVMRVGGTPARVSTVVGTTITIDDALETGPYSYGYTYRSPAGIITTSTLTVVNSNTFTVAGAVPAVGDLIIIGIVGQITLDCLVKSITPNDDLSATLDLIEKADGIFAYESTGDFPDYEPNLLPQIDPKLSAPGEVNFLSVIENSWRVVSREYQHYVKIDWDVPTTGPAYDSFEIYVDDGNGYDLAASTKLSQYTYDVDSANLGVEHKFKVLAVSINGNKLALGEVGFVAATPEKKIARPSNVEHLYLNITNETIQLEWKQIIDADCNHYVIRFSPVLDDIWERSIPLMIVDRNLSMAFTQSRTGTYFIKAVDFNGNESASPAQAYTSIPGLFNLNVVETIDDFPTLGGDRDRVSSDGVSLLLQESVSGVPAAVQYHAEGYYYYQNLLDLGDIYTVRLQSRIEAEGYTPNDLMSNWLSLDDVLSLTNALSSAWDVETQVRYTNAYNVISEWPDMNSIIRISEGNADLFTPWKKFTIGDYTGRVFQFRLKLVSTNINVTPRVFNGSISADMPDRTDHYNNLVSGVGAYSLTYGFPFKGPGATPNIQITVDDSETGDYYQLLNKTLNGFDITFYDSTNTVVSRQFDVAVKGFGRRNTVVV